MKTMKLVKIAVIALLLSAGAFINAATAQTTPTILIDGVSVQANNVSITPYWLNATQTLAVGNLTKFISVVQYIIAPAQGGGNSLQFESIIKVTTQQAVPAGKAWKVESVALDPTASSTVGDNLGNHVATTNLNMSNFKINNVANPTALTDAVNATALQNGNLIYAADAGTANAYAVTLSPAPTVYTAGMTVNFRATNASTGASTLNVNGLGAKSIKKQVSVDLIGNDVIAGQLVTVIYDGTNFQMISPVATSAGLGAANVFAATSWQSSNTSSNWENISTISYTIPQNGLYYVICSYESQDGGGGTNQYQRLLLGSVIGNQESVGPNQTGYQFKTIDNLITLTAGSVIYLQNQNNWNNGYKNTVRNIQFSIIKMN